MKMINENQVFEDWFPLIESKTDIQDPYKKEWLAKYSHYHALNESEGGYNTLASLVGMGQPVAPTRTATGSGDKFPSLLPLAIQVAAKTVGFDIVPVIPMPGPTGVLTYLDYVYAGGRVDSEDRPLVIKANVTGTWTVGTNYTATSGAGDLTVAFVGYSRIDAYPIFRIVAASVATLTVAQVFGQAGATVTTDAALLASTQALLDLFLHLKTTSLVSLVLVLLTATLGTDLSLKIHKITSL
jgi:hypothetical protein